MTKWAFTPVLLALGLVNPGLVVRDADGVNRHPLRVGDARATALFFVASDCPISNSFAHEIARVCSEYDTKGISCSLVYVDPLLTDPQALAHANEYGHGRYARIVDRHHDLVKATGVTITPEVAVVDKTEHVVYRGRIDDSYAALGQPRRAMRNADLRNALDDVIAGRPVAHPETKALGCYIPDLAVLGRK